MMMINSVDLRCSYDELIVNALRWSLEMGNFYHFLLFYHIHKNSLENDSYEQHGIIGSVL